jgi:1,4-alpha-glucan branching enzyme
MVTVYGRVAIFEFYRPQVAAVCLVGDFTRWQSGMLPMIRTGKGVWVASLRLPPGEYRFRYYADGQWFTDYAAFGVEIGPFGPDSLLRIAAESPGPSAIGRKDTFQAVA